MSLESCYPTWKGAPPFGKAQILDAAHPHCCCEEVALMPNGGVGVSNTERIARILTSDGDENNPDSILRSTLSSVYSCGLSTVRQGATDQEILETINLLTDAKNPVKFLVGASLLNVSEARAFNAGNRWFGIYATEDELKTHHADILGTAPPAPSNSALRREQSHRRNALRLAMLPNIILSSDPGELIKLLRSHGI